MGKTELRILLTPSELDDPPHKAQIYPHKAVTNAPIDGPTVIFLPSLPSSAPSP